MAAHYQGEKVVIFKSMSESDSNEKDPYYEACRTSGFDATVIPVLDFKFVNLDILLNKFRNSEQYEGIIFSSPRCIEAIQLCMQKTGEEKSILNNWKYCKTFVVGEKTGKLAEDLGFSVTGQNTGCGSALAELISKDIYRKPFLYPIGSLTNKDFKSKLKTNNIELDDIVVYETKQHVELKENILKLQSNISNQSALFVFFSPSGVNFSLPILKSLKFDFELIKFIAIGPTTKASLLRNEIQVAKTCDKPNTQSLIQALQSLK